MEKRKRKRGQRRFAKVYPADKFLSALAMVARSKVLGRYILDDDAISEMLDKAYTDGYVDAGLEQLEHRIKVLEAQARSIDGSCTFQMQNTYNPYANATPQGIGRP